MKKIRLAQSEELSSLKSLYEACTAHLLDKNIFQWDSSYPTKEHILYHVTEKELYVLEDSTGIYGAVVLNEWQSPEWQEVAWQGDNPLIIHMLCVHPLKQNVGAGKDLLQFAEKIAKEKRYNSLRLDSFSGNEKSLSFYEKAGYKEVGAVYFTGKVKGNEKYICYEKML
jgi:ribosomal protein S18 acetylase RimI-like enzyme